jgi:TPR repeat protein
MILPKHILDMNPTWAELSCTALAQIAVNYVITGKVKSSEKKSLRSHALIFLNAQPAASMFPRTVDRQEYFVVFANMNTTDLDIEKRARLLVRCNVTDALSDHYRRSLDKYRDVPTDNAAFFGAGIKEKILESNWEDDGQESTIIADAALPFQRPGFVPTGSGVIGFFGKAGGDSSPQIDSNVPDGELPAVLVVKRSSDCMNHRSRDAELAAFPDLHSNGLGNVYDDKRKVSVSPSAARQHLARLSNRMFAQHETWLMVNFDHMNKDNGQGYLSARLRRDPSLATSSYHVTEGELRELLEHQKDVKRCAQNGSPMPAFPENLQNAQRVISNIRAVESTLHGSEEERESFRRTMYAFVFQIGAPHFMLTVTPNDSANGIVATISKGGGSPDDPLAHFELNDAETVKKRHLIQELASKDPVACAIYFDEILTHIFVNILGFNAETYTAQQGLFGKIGWIGGGIENQGSQLLHAHLCIYVEEWPLWLKGGQRSGNPDVPLICKVAGPRLSAEMKSSGAAESDSESASSSSASDCGRSLEADEDSGESSDNYFISSSDDEVEDEGYSSAGGSSDYGGDSSTQSDEERFDSDEDRMRAKIRSVYFEQADYPEAAKLFTLLADDQSSFSPYLQRIAAYQLGYMHEKGQGVETDDAKALEWYRVAASRNDSSAQYALGWAYHRGLLGVVEDLAVAVEHLKLAAASKHLGAMGMLGSMFLKGEGVPQDVAIAKEYLLPAALEGDDVAQGNMGFWYMTEQPSGWYTEATYWLKKSAKQNCAHAMYLLGICISDSCDRDCKTAVTAVRWLKKAARLGHALAISKVGEQDGSDSEIDSSVVSEVVSGGHEERFTEADIVALTDYVTSTDYPLLNLFYQPTASDPLAILCPSCGNGTLKGEPLTIFHKTDQVKCAPFVASCGCCKKHFTSSALHEQCVAVVTGIVNDMVKLNSADISSAGFNPEKEADLYIISGVKAFPIPDVASALLAPARNIVQDVCAGKCSYAEVMADEDIPAVDSAALLNYFKDVTRLSVGLFSACEHKYVTT